MTREIKFRAWNGDKMITFPEGMYGAEWDSVIMSSESVLLQYTGRKDKNNNEIYDGDIVKAMRGVLYKVIWSHHESQWATEIISPKYNDVDGFCATSIFEVIGNIYENRELLET